MNLFTLKSRLPQKHKPLWAALFLCFVLLVGAGIGFLTNHPFSENAKFEQYTEELFRQEVASNTLNLHYALAFPEKLGIAPKEVSLGTVIVNPKEVYALCETRENQLKNFSYSKLSRENQLTLDMLLLYYHTQRSLGDNYLLEEVLGPSLGIQAQLPVLLAEYAFYRDEDISNYLNLLKSVPAYFESILEFENQKSQAGVFMSDATLERILAQCAAFIENPDSNYMLEIFSQKLADYGKFSEEEQKELNAVHQKILCQEVIPAYQSLIDGLCALRGTGKSSRGLANFPGGKEYYRYLIKSQTGVYQPLPRIEKRLATQLLKDMKEIQLMLREQGSLAFKVNGNVDFPDMEPSHAMEAIREQMKADFPELSDVSYEIRSVHPSMEDFLSPAFYLTPPLDTQSPNVIYINHGQDSSNLELFTTLAHEGFPGHLYQTVSFGRKNPSHIRYLINSSGYVEGWATYVESFAYGYAAAFLKDEAAVDVTRLAGLNRSVNLCIFSLLDIGIHYHGWDLGETTKFLRTFGITESSTVQEIFQYIVETPANYLKYYLGYLNFLDLRTACQKRLGEDFDMVKFHESILDIGPVQFPVLEKHLLQSLPHDA